MKYLKLTTIIASLTLLVSACGGSDPSPSPEHVHQWSTPTYEWSEDNATCTAERVCQLDETHKETETSYSKYSVVTYPTASTNGEGRYTSTFENTAFVTQVKTVSIPATGDIDTFEKAVNNVRTQHNYSAHLDNQFDGEAEKFASFNYYNIYDDALYSDMNGYYSGYIKQKDQGIVTFAMPLDSSGLFTGSFVATNLERGVSDYYNANIEYLVGAEQILSKQYTYDVNKDVYVCSDWEAIAMIATMAFGFSTEASAIAPEYFTATFIDNKLVISATFRVIYFNEVEVNIPAYVTLEISNFGSTHNERIETYVANPDYTYVAPTEWNSDIKDCFDDRFNSYYPPFISGLSYSWDYYYAWNEGYGAIVIEDYFAGDLVTSYINTLLGNGFKQAENPYYTEYVKVEEDNILKHTYSVKMKYHAPDEIDAGGIRYSYLYPNGLTTFIFLHKQQTKSQITNVKLLNEYIANTAAGGFMPAFGLSDDTKVANFADATATESEVYAFKSSGVEGSGSNFFRIYPESKAVAITFFEKLKEDLASVGLSTQQTAFDQLWISDDYGSTVRITDPNNISTWTSNSYLQVRIEITKKSIEEYNKEIIYIDYLTITGQTTSFTVGSEFVFDGKVDVTYTDGNVVEDVTPTEIVAPDMNVVGPQTVIIKYQDEQGRVGAANYVVNINPTDTEYNISVIQPTGATITVTMPSNMVSKAGYSVTFKVIAQSGYVVSSVSVTCNGKPVEVGDENPITHTRLFIMPAGDVTISAVVAPEEAMHNLNYVVYDKDTLEVLDFNSVIASNSKLPKTAVNGETVTFEVNTKEGYTFNFIWIKPEVLCIEPYQYHVSASDPKTITVEIHVIVEGSGGEGGGEGGDVDPSILYSFQMEASGCYWKLSFNDDGTGTYEKIRKSTSVLEASLEFNYVLNTDTGTLNISDIGGSPSDWGNYRLTTKSDGTGTNSTGIISGDTLTISLYNYSGTATSCTFIK